MTKMFSLSFFPVLLALALVVVPLAAQTQPQPPAPKVQYYHVTSHPFIGGDPLAQSMAKTWTPQIWVMMQATDPATTMFLVTVKYRDRDGVVHTRFDTQIRGGPGSWSSSFFLVPVGATLTYVNVSPQTSHATAYEYQSPL